MSGPGRHYEFGHFRLNPAEHQLLRHGQTVRLTPKAFETLLVLVEHRTHLVTKEALLKAVWPDTFVEESGLTRNISVLRRTLGGTGKHQYIETVPKRGYRFVADVRVTPAAYGALVPANITSRTIDRDPGAGLRSVAILPFRPIGAEGNEFLGLGMADTLITKLNSIRQVVVRPTGSVRKYTGTAQDPQAAGRELQVDTVLEGSVQRWKNRIRVTVRLLRVCDGTTLWAETFDEKFTHIFAVQDSISERSARALMLQLSTDDERRLTRRYTENAEAYQLYLKGRYFYNQRTERGLLRAVEYFRKAIDRDPNYALAYSGLADSYTHFDRYEVLSAKDGGPRGKAAALKAVEIDPALSEGHTSLAHASFFWEWDWLTAERELRLALELKPSYADAHLRYAAYLSAMGRHVEALAEMTRAQELDPLSLIINTLLGRTFYFARRYDEAIDQLRKTLEIDPNFERALLFLGLVCAQKGLLSEAITELRQAMAPSRRGPIFVGALGYAYGRSGKRHQAQKLIAELHERSRQGYVSAYNLALIYAGLGEKAKALDSLATAYEERSSWMVFLGVTPAFDDLRANTGFVQLLRRLGLPQIDS
jgi:DNA-binding winged helix-turn-helix (wHTH) protein/tetratricopeptide (TPR) repeat protein